VTIVPQQHAWVVERLGKFHATLTPGLKIVNPFIDRIPTSQPEGIPPTHQPGLITRDNTQLAVDGVLFFQVTDRSGRRYGASIHRRHHAKLAQTRCAR